MPLSDDSSFDERLSHWIASQGFWFQLRHGSGRSAGVSGMFSRLLHMAVRTGVLVLLALGVLVVYLFKRTDTQAFRDALPDSAAAALFAKSAETKGFQREGARVYIHRLSAEGGKSSFFYNLEGHGIRYDMDLLDGLVGVWDAGTITVRMARIDLKAGAEDDEEAAAISEGLFGKHDWFGFSSIDVRDATVSWGYSARTRGMIEGSHLLVQRVEDGWKLRFEGGEFSQNWLKRLEIDEMIVRIDPDGMRIEKADFRRGDGRVELKGVVKAGRIPEIDAELKFDGLSVSSILPREARAFAEGSISGTGKIAGSTNSQKGVGVDCLVVLGADDRLILRDRVPLLQALSVVDIYNNYRRVEFLKGGFHLVTGGGRMTLENVDLDAAELMHLTGRMVARPPTDEEVVAALAEEPTKRDAALINSLAGGNDADNDGEVVKKDITLRKAAKAAREDEENGMTVAPTIGMMNRGMMPQNLEQQARNRYARLLRFEGGFEIEIPGDAFERAKALREEHPADPTTGRIRLEVPIGGNLFDLTYKQALELYSKGRRNQ